MESKVGETAPKFKYKPLSEIYAMPGHRVTQEDREILVVRVDESLFFANTGQMKDRLRRAEAYEGLLHIHPSEEERRPIFGALSAQNMGLSAGADDHPRRPLGNAQEWSREHGTNAGITV